MNKENLLKLAKWLNKNPASKINMLPPSQGAVVYCASLLPTNEVVFVEDKIDHNACAQKFTEIAIMSPEWYWLFSLDWRGIDEKKGGLARRIEYLVFNHRLPDNWLQQMKGCCNLSY